jgi:hypothetical protein
MNLGALVYGVSCIADRAASNSYWSDFRAAGDHRRGQCDSCAVDKQYDTDVCGRQYNHYR